MSNFKRLLQNGNGLATYTGEEIQSEVARRERSSNVFPLDVFNDKIKPFINTLNKGYDLPASYIGLTLLSAYSTAIGTAYRIDTGNRDFIFLPVWSCICGISSSGGTTALNKIYDPLFRIQNEFDFQWEEKIRGLNAEKINQCKIDQVIYRDSHIPTLVKSILPDNPKGVCKTSDELLEWINGMNQLSKKEGTDEQFWISAWNCQNYSGIRSGKQKFVVHRPFVNVIGKAQYQILGRLFSKDRDTTGFIFRMLFAVPEIDKISQRDSSVEMPQEWMDLHDQSLSRLFKDLPVLKPDEDSKNCVLDPSALKLFDAWRKEKTHVINQIEDSHDQNIRAGIFGKITEYVYRFSAILHLSDKTFDPEYGGDFHTAFRSREVIPTKTLERALKLADYFYKSAEEVYELVQKSLNAPDNVLAVALLLRKGKSYTDLGELLYGTREAKNKVKARRQVQRWIREYPRVFGAIAR